MKRRRRRVTTGARAWLPLTVLLAGCSSQASIPRERLLSGLTLERSVVTLKNGTQYRFNQVTLRPDTLVGQFNVTVERQSPEVGAYYETVPSSYAIPLSNVDSVAVFRRDVGKTVLYGAGLAAVTVALHSLVSSTQPTPVGGGVVIKRDPGGGGRN